MDEQQRGILQRVGEYWLPKHLCRLGMLVHSIIPAFRGLRKEGYKFKASYSYIERYCLRIMREHIHIHTYSHTHSHTLTYTHIHSHTY